MYIYPTQYRRYVLDCPLAGGHIYILNTSFGSKLGAAVFTPSPPVVVMGSSPKVGLKK
jgi:hypothetical protein